MQDALFPVVESVVENFVNVGSEGKDIRGVVDVASSSSISSGILGTTLRTEYIAVKPVRFFEMGAFDRIVSQNW